MSSKYGQRLVAKDNNFANDVIEVLHDYEGKAIFCPEMSSIGTTSLLRNAQYAKNEEYPVVVTTAGYLTEFGQRMYKTKGRLYELNYPITLRENADIAGKYAARLFEGEGCAALGKEIRDYWLFVMRKSGYHSDYAISLEKDRVAGKQAIDDMSLPQADYCHLQSVEDLKDLSRFGDLDTILYVKYNEKASIGSYTIRQIHNLLSVWLETGSVVAETFIHSGSEGEVNFCFVSANGNVWPAAVLIESNKIFDNEGGGKTGTATAYHAIAKLEEDGLKCSVHQEHFNTVYAALQKWVKENPDEFYGWFDLSFMVKDGQLYFTEWMVRSAVSNFATLTHQLKLSYFDLLDRIACNNFPYWSDTWRSEYSYSVELYRIPMFNDIELTCIEIPLPEELRDANSNIAFDPLLESAEIFDGKTVIVPNYMSRIGVLSVLSDEQMNMESRVFPDSVIQQFQPYVRLFQNNVTELAYRSYKV